MRLLKPVKLLIGLALLPLAWALTKTLAHLFASLPSASAGIPAALWWFAGGFVFWIVLWLLLPRPARTYVLAHELTHAVWGLAMGAKVSRLRVRENGGSVNLTKTNVWITLAPYFFPLYTVLLIVALIPLRFLWPDLQRYEPFWLAMVGLTWGFHVTFTLAVLQQHQPDVEEHGRIFSWTLIYILNLLGLLVWILAVTRAGFAHWGFEILSDAAHAYVGALNAAFRGLSLLRQGQGSA